MHYLTHKLAHIFATASALALAFTLACTDDVGSSEGADESGGEGESGTGNDSAEGNDSSMDTGDGDGDTTGDGDGDTTGDGDGDTTGDGDGDCAPMEAEAVGDCEAILGTAWNGEACVVLVGCECVGADCPSLFESPDVCEAAYADCANNDGCGGLDLETCTATEQCNPIFGSLLEFVGDVGWCALEPSYMGCSSQLGCGDAISFACPEGEDAIYQTTDTCIPDQGYVACEAPDNQGVYESCA